MTAPALVMLANGSTDAHVTQVTHALRVALQWTRPEIQVNAAFLDHCPPTGPQVVSQLVSRGTEEIVFVPLHLSNAVDNDPAVDVVVHRVRAANPSARFAVSRPIGPAGSLLTIMDERLRAALATSHVLELDGLVLSAESAGDPRGSSLLARRARQWSAHHRLPCVTAINDGTGPTIVQAIASLRAQGRRHIAVGSLFLAPDAHYEEQAQLALRNGAVAVSAPIGADSEVLDLVLARYAFAAMDLLDLGLEPMLEEAVSGM